MARRFMKLHPRNLWPLLIAAGLLLFFGCCGPQTPDNGIATISAQLSEIKAQLIDANAHLDKIEKRRIFPLGDEKGAK